VVLVLSFGWPILYTLVVPDLRHTPRPPSHSCSAPTLRGSRALHAIFTPEDGCRCACLLLPNAKIKNQDKNKEILNTVHNITSSGLR
jgi:hypothetical protein